MRLFFVRVDGRMVARSWIRCELQENLGSAFLHVDVLNDFTGRGIGRALLEHAEALAAADGRTILHDLHGAPGRLRRRRPGRHQARHRDRRAAGRRPRRPLRRTARATGWSRWNGSARLAVPPARGTCWTPWSGKRWPGRRTTNWCTWTDRCPDEYVEQLAVLMSRMSTDAPTGGLSYEPKRPGMSPASGTSRTPGGRPETVSLVTAARHRDNGELAAYSVLELAPSKPWLADQDDTLVAASHRGHRLGMLVKIRNLRRLLAEYPAVERVITFNAAENDHMLAINIALGFRPAGCDGEWQNAWSRRVTHGTATETGIC